MQPLSQKSIVFLAAVLMGCSTSQSPDTAEAAPRIHLPRVFAQFTQPPTRLQDLSPNSVNQTIHIEGQVRQHVPLVDGWLYQIEDSTAVIWIATGTAPPAVGESVRIQGVVHYQQILVNNTDIGEFYLEEVSRAIRDRSE